jgi:curved DNA-binding protein CbpA
VAEPRRDPYAILGVPRTATRAEIARAFRQLAKRAHPDVGGQGGAGMQELNWAWNLLSDPRRRTSWDATHAPPGATGSHWTPPPPASRGQPTQPADDWRSPPPWTVSGESWAGDGAPVIGRRAGLGCTVILLVILVMSVFVLFAGLTPQVR